MNDALVDNYKIRYYIMQTNKEDLYKKLKKSVRSTNALLGRLYAQIDRDHPGWAASRLLNKLDNDIIAGVSKKGYIRYNKDLSIGQMRAILKASEQFRKSKTSTVKGTKENIEAIKRALGNTLDITSDSATKIYEFFGTEKYNISDEVKYDIVIIANEFKNTDKSVDDYIKTVKKYIDFGNDVDVKKLLKTVYNYVDKKATFNFDIKW